MRSKISPITEAEHRAFIKACRMNGIAAIPKSSNVSKKCNVVIANPNFKVPGDFKLVLVTNDGQAHFLGKRGTKMRTKRKIPKRPNLTKKSAERISASEQ